MNLKILSHETFLLTELLTQHKVRNTVALSYLDKYNM